MILKGLNIGGIVNILSELRISLKSVTLGIGDTFY
jgi:hypothetical protein